MADTEATAPRSADPPAAAPPLSRGGCPLYPAGMDSAVEETGFEPSVPSREGGTSSRGPEGPEVDYDCLVGPVPLRGDREFESLSSGRTGSGVPSLSCQEGRAA